MNDNLPRPHVLGLALVIILLAGGIIWALSGYHFPSPMVPVPGEFTQSTEAP